MAEQRGTTADHYVALERREKSAEIDLLVGTHGLTFAKACRLVMLRPREYLANQPACEWFPSPALIAQEAAAIQSGSFVVDATAAALDLAERHRNKRYDLAAEIDDDAVVIPDWFLG